MVYTRGYQTAAHGPHAAPHALYATRIFYCKNCVILYNEK
jgi:hypothetical protein